MVWSQRSLTLKPKPRGAHLITRDVIDALPEINEVQIGLLHLFLQHTSASLTINENADPDVRRDLTMAINHVVPEKLPYTHTLEGSDDMPAHVKATLTGVGLTLPISQGRLLLGVWQGVYLCEHRDHGGPRTLVLTLHGA